MCVKALRWGALARGHADGAVQANYFAVLGISAYIVLAVDLFTIIGVAEMAMGMLALAFPAPAALLFLAIWKISSELLRPAAGEPLWEFIERASNMAAPLALLYLRRPTAFPGWFTAPPQRRV